MIQDEKSKRISSRTATRRAFSSITRQLYDRCVGVPFGSVEYVHLQTVVGWPVFALAFGAYFFDKGLWVYILFIGIRTLCLTIMEFVRLTIMGGLPCFQQGKKEGFQVCSHLCGRAQEGAAGAWDQTRAN